MKKKIVSISSICVFFLTLIVLATMFDLSISKSLAGVNNLDIIVLIGSYGKLPAYLGLVCGFMLIYGGLNDRLHNTIFLLVVKVTNIICIIISMFLLLDYLLPYFVIINIIVSLVCGIGMVGLIEKYKTHIRHLFYFGLLIVGTVVLSAVIIEALKLIMCRVRFYVLHNANDYAGFTPWFECMFGTDIRTPEYLLSHGINSASWWGMDEFMSFPSGHAGMVSTILLLNFLPNYIEKLKKYKWLILVLTILVTIFVCFSRVLALMHYMSDVVFGVIITVFAMVIVNFVVNLIKKRL